MKHISTLQPLFGVDRSNPLFELLFNPKVPNEILVHFGTVLLETVERNSFQEKLLIARLYNSGFNRCSLEREFKYSRKSMQSWGDHLKSGKSENIIKIAEGQGAVKKITDDRLLYIEHLFMKHYENEGCHINAFIVRHYKEVYRDNITVESIRLCLLEIRKKFDEQRELQRKNRENEVRKLDSLYCSESCFSNKNIIRTAPDKVPDLAGATNMTGENTWINPEISCSTFQKKSKYSPPNEVSAANNFPFADNRPAKILSCHHVGILISRIFIDTASVIDSDISDIIRQWTAMILCNCLNIEQGQRLDYRALELFIGKQLTSANKQRDKLKSIAEQKNVNTIFENNIRMIGAENDNTFLIDPHGVPYYGQLPLLKCYLGGVHAIGKGYYLDLIHTTKGEPVFSMINDNYYDLRQRFAANIREFRKILGGTQNRTLTFVVDRAVFGLHSMKEIQKENVHIITWEKDYKKGSRDSNSLYPVKTFSIMKYRNRKEDTYTYTVQYFKRCWEKDNSSAQYIVMLTKPDKEAVELSILCTDYTYDEQTAITLILTRWLQENDIGYLILLGINQITSYLYESYEDIAETLTDRQVENKEFASFAVQKLKMKKEIGLLIVDREIYIEKKEQHFTALSAEIEKYTVQLSDLNISVNSKKSIEIKLRKAKSKIKRLPKDRDKTLKNNEQKQALLWEKIKEIDEKMKDLPHKASRLETLIREEYARLNFMPKSFMDAIKINARNIIYQLLEIFRPIWNNYRNDLVILRELISAMGHIKENDKNIMICLNPARQYTKKQKHRIFLFLFEISNRANQYYKLDKNIIFSLYDL